MCMLQYLSGHTLAGTVLQKESYHIQVILLGCHVQRSEAILYGPNHTHILQKHGKTSDDSCHLPTEVCVLFFKGNAYIFFPLAFSFLKNICISGERV